MEAEKYFGYQGLLKLAQLVFGNAEQLQNESIENLADTI